jgi:signal transduction histidine kinase
VQHTLGTVTERLQQILRTVRRDPNKTDLTRVDLSALARDTAATWGDIGRDKWKVTVTAEATRESLWVEGDFSHLQQAVENLVFNARDATFEMRNYLREEARRGRAEDRKAKLLDAAGWRGQVVVTVRADDGGGVLLEVRDNGIGMTAEVKANCLTTHFSTKRDNALFAGFSAGMGLGLSFVAVVLEHHHAELTIDSAPLQGATFRVRFPPPGKSEPDA